MLLRQSFLTPETKFAEQKRSKKISGHQQSWSRPLPGAILIPPALLMAADFSADPPKSAADRKAES